MQIARKSVLAVGRIVSKRQRATIARNRSPYAVGEPGRTTVRAVPAATGLQMILNTVDRETSTENTTDITTDGRTEILPDTPIIHHIVEPADHIGHRAVAVGNDDRDDACSVIGHADLHAGLVGQTIKSGRAIIDHGTEIGRPKSGNRLLLRSEATDRQKGSGNRDGHRNTRQTNPSVHRPISSENRPASG